MALVYPSGIVARRWQGALQARLRRAPLEKFLRMCKLVPAPVGVAQDSDNLIRATVFIVEAGLKLHFNDRAEGLEESQQPVVGHFACLISRALAALISEPGAWRIAALISTAQLLSPWIGLNAAAVASATFTRHFYEDCLDASPAMDGRVSAGASAAVSENDAKALAYVIGVIATGLAATRAFEPGPVCKLLP